MTYHILNANLNDFLSNLETYIPELIPVHSELLQDLPCLVLYGNEDMYLEIYARLLIQQYYELPKLPTLAQQEEFQSSAYHFEFNYQAQHIEVMKKIIQNKNISGRKFIFVVKNFITNQKQYQLKTLMENNNVMFILLAKTTSHLCEGIRSRATFLRLAFSKSKLKQFLANHYQIEYNPDDHRSIISIIADLGQPKYEIELEKLISLMQKSRNQIDVSNAIKDYCYKVFHLCVPLSHLAKLIIQKQAKHPKITQIVDACAKSESNMVTSTRDILCYEAILVNLWNILKS